MFTVALGKPDVSHLGGHASGYNYNKPVDNYVGPTPLRTNVQEPANSYIPPASGNPFGTGLDIVAPQTYSNGASSNYQQAGLFGSSASTHPTSGGGAYTNGVTTYPTSGAGTYSTNGAGTYPTTGASYAGQQYSPSVSGSGSLLQSYQNSQALNQQYAPQSYTGQSYTGQSYDSAQQLPPIVTKHFYFHAAPEDPEERAGPRFVQVGRSRKNYKVIFIKAPTYGSSQQIVPIVPQNEEKTIVYVLSKKPSFNQEVQLPEQPVTEPSKPEVFFIKYKNQEEAQKAQQQIQCKNRITI